MRRWYPIIVAVWLLAAGAIVLTRAFAPVQLPAVPVCEPNQPAWPWLLDVDTVLRRVPPLRHDANGRMPMVCWIPFVRADDANAWRLRRPLPADDYRQLARRGLTQAIPFNEKYIPIAQALQQAGAKVICMEGGGGAGPAADANDWQHHLPPEARPPKGKTIYPCPLIERGWQVRAEKVRATAKEFRDAGVTLDGVWLDWEVEPLTWSRDRWRQAQACPRCQEMFPPGTLAGWDSWWKYKAVIHKLRAELFSRYVAEPILETFPDCWITNWEAIYSTPEIPSRSCWGTSELAPQDIGKLTAANPVAYSNTEYYTIYDKYPWSRIGGPPLAPQRMDRLYFSIMLGQVSRHAANAQRLAPDKKSLPWVARTCRDVEQDSIPSMSRQAYRELLRHVWLRGADGMQIFDPISPKALAKNTELAVEEIEDAVAVFDEMLPYRRFLDGGWILNTDVPGIRSTDAIWSGLRLDREALVRAYSPGGSGASVLVRAWDDAPAVRLAAPPEGATYILTRRDGAVDVRKEEQP